MHDIDCKIMDYIKLHGEIDGDTIEAFVSGDDKALRQDNGIDLSTSSSSLNNVSSTDTTLVRLV